MHFDKILLLSVHWMLSACVIDGVIFKIDKLGHGNELKTIGGELLQNGWKCFCGVVCAAVQQDDIAALCL